jgi:hypothetical protein
MSLVIRHYDPESKQESNTWKCTDFPPLNKCSAGPSSGKMMLILFLGSKDIIHQHRVPQKQIMLLSTVERCIKTA